MIKIFLLLTIILFFFYYFKLKNIKENFENSSNIPILIITDEKYFNDQKNLLKKIGFNKIYLINPVYIKDTKKYCKKIKISKGELGCSYAHLNALKKIIKLNKSCIVFEKDWTYNIPNIKFKKEIIKYYNSHKENNITYLGYCGNGCTHGYIISPQKAKLILKNKNRICNDPIDMVYNKYYCKKNECIRIPDKYKKNKKLFGNGLILQDRNKYVGMHNSKNKKTKLFY